jgi:hypothetical protein
VKLKEAKDQGKRYAHSKLAQREAEDELQAKRIEACKRAIGKHVGDSWISRSKFANSHLRSNLKPYLDKAIEELDGRLIEVAGAKQGGLRMRRLDLG